MSTLDLIPLNDAAALLGLHRNGLLALVERNEIPASHLGARWYFSRDFLEGWLCTSDNEPKHDDLYWVMHDRDVVKHAWGYRCRRDLALRAGAQSLSAIPGPDAPSPPARPASTPSPDGTPVRGKGRVTPPTRTVLGIEFLSLVEVCRRTGVSRLTVLRAFNSGQLPGKKLGATWQTTPLWLDEWVKTPDVGRELTDDPNAEPRRIWRVLKLDVHKLRVAGKMPAAATASRPSEVGDPDDDELPDSSDPNEVIFK